MNKTELVDQIATAANISKAAAGRALEGALAAIRTSLRKGQPVSLVGFGTFHVGRRASRSGRNPRTGAPICLKAHIMGISFSYLALTCRPITNPKLEKSNLNK